MRVADAHLHLLASGFAGSVARSLFASEIGAYERFRGLHGIEAGLVIGYEGEGIDPDNNAYIRRQARDRPWMTTVAYVSCDLPPKPETIARHLQDGHAGISLYPADAREAAAVAAWPSASWQHLNANRAIVSLNAEPACMDALRPVVTANTGCIFLVSHLGMPGRFAEPPAAADAVCRLAPLLRAAQSPNVVVKLSGLYAVSDPPHAYPHAAAEPFLTAILERFGPGRCVWGSDFSPALEYVSFAQTLAIPMIEHLGEEDRNAVMYENLVTMLRRFHGD